MDEMINVQSTTDEKTRDEKMVDNMTCNHKYRISVLTNLHCKQSILNNS